MSLARSMFQRRERRHTWAYLVWLLVYVFEAWFLVQWADFVRFLLGAPPFPNWPFVLPIAIVVAHVVYPTLVGWLLVLLPSIAWTAFATYCVICSVIEMPLQKIEWGTVLLFVATPIAVCVALVFARPSKCQSSLLTQSEGSPAKRQ